jgi:hypothetical protein
MRVPESSQNLPPSLDGERYPATWVLAAAPTLLSILADPVFECPNAPSELRDAPHCS